MDSEKRVADYFIISGISDKFEQNIETKPFINSALPITDITVIFKGLGEQCPEGYECIETTPNGHSADLNNGNFKSPNIHLCYRRGTDKPPILDVGVYYEDRERVLPDVEVVFKTPYGRCASTGNTSPGTFITFKRDKTPTLYGQLVVVDLCIILNNKSEHAPHAFYAQKKNLNRSIYGMIGSEVFLCYKKTFLNPPSIYFTPHIISRFPLQDYANSPLPDKVPLFCLPAGANIELRPANSPPSRTLYSTFVLTSDSAQKMYGCSLIFSEPFDQDLLTQEQKQRLGLANQDVDDAISISESDNTSARSQKPKMDTFVKKSICILSRWPFFESFEKYLSFLHKLVFSQQYTQSNPNSPTHFKSNIALEHHISHFLLDVSFPTPQKPSVLVQLLPGTDETLTICQPSSRLPLPLTGASFLQLLDRLGVDITMNVLLFVLCEQKILLHSLNPWILTGVAEAITAILFPFHWQCPYVPLCPLSLHGIVQAPTPFIVGIDSRCFDTFTPPDDVICIDLDTRSLYLSPEKKCLNARMLPRKAAQVLRGTLEKIDFQWIKIRQTLGDNQSPRHYSRAAEDTRKQVEKRIELEIQEAFVRFMATILRGFRSYLLPITRAPTIGTTDPTSLFDFDGFLNSRDRSHSQFYRLMVDTQMFTHYIEERSFVSDKDTSLAFFDDCEEKLVQMYDMFSERQVKLFDKDDGIIPTDRSTYIPAPDQSPSVSAQPSHDILGAIDQLDAISNKKLCRFGPLNPALFHRHPQSRNLLTKDKLADDCNEANRGNNDMFDLLLKNQYGDAISSIPGNRFSLSRRTKQEVKTSQKKAKKSAETPLNWSKYLVSCCHCLWFATLPSYITYCKSRTEASSQDQQDSDDHSKEIARILRYAYALIVRMQKLELTTDEICFRVLTLLCGYHGQPALAVRVFFEMKKAGIKPNAVTYGYYNKAVLESRWPDHTSKPTTVLWTKIRNVISGITLFRAHGRLRRDRRTKRAITLIGDPGFVPYHGIDVSDTITSMRPNDLFPPTTVPIQNDLQPHDPSGGKFGPNHHRRSLVNRSYSTYQKSTIDVTTSTNDDHMDLLGQTQSKRAIHKSYSMHLRNDRSPERGSLLRVKSNSIDHSDDDADDDDGREVDHNEGAVHMNEIDGPPIIQKLVMAQGEASNLINLNSAKSRITSTHDLFHTLMERRKLLIDDQLDGISIPSMNDLQLVDNSSGILFTTNLDSYRSRHYCSRSPKLAEHKDSQITAITHDLIASPTRTNYHQTSLQNEELKLLEPQLVDASKPNLSQNTPKLLDTSSFGEDAKILRKLEPSHTQRQRPDLSSSVDNIQESGNAFNDVTTAGSIESRRNYRSGLDEDCDGFTTSDETKEDEEYVDDEDDFSDPPSEFISDEDRDQTSMRNVISTPNFKLASLINDASNLQWSKWTSTQNSKSVYKSVKSAATGFVSQLQDLKSSFSISNSATPSKFLSNTQQRSATRDIISQLRGYLYQPSKTGEDESDSGSDCSNDLLRLSNEEDHEPTSADVGDFRVYQKLFALFDNYYKNTNHKDDLLDHITTENGTPTSCERVAIEIRITTCSRCNICHSLLYDEEIMERWSHNESNLNTRCIYCRAKIVPFMTIEVEDFRFKNEPTINNELVEKPGKVENHDNKNAAADNITNDLVDLNFGDDEDKNQDLSATGAALDGSKTESGQQQDQKRHSQISQGYQQTFTVPYLSPIVLRKELESVFESSGDTCPASSQFIDEHPIIYWNLLWYCERINVPTHLAFLCLHAKSILNGRDASSTPDEAKSLDKVVVRALWDNDKLYAQVGKPLYRLLERGEVSINVESIIGDELYFTTSFLDRVINLIRGNDLHMAMSLVLNERLKSSTRFSFDKNRHNLYRDLIFLMINYYGASIFYMGK